MREHWLECHGIEVDEILVPMVVPDMLKEPGKNNLKVQGSSGTQSSTPGPSGPPGGAPGPGGETSARPVTNPVPSKRTTNLDKKEVRRIAKAQSKLQMKGKPNETKEAPSDPNPDSNSSEVPMDAESQGEPDKELVKFTGSKLSEYVPDSDLETSELELAKELKEYEKK